MNDIDIQKILEHLENIDKSLDKIAVALRYIAYKVYCHKKDYPYDYGQWIREQTLDDALSDEFKY